VIDSVFPLADAAGAHARLEHPDRFGKVVLTVDEGRAS
jgi:NADPH:quinone reductase-like Zn-dependent oxidoreductase